MALIFLHFSYYSDSIDKSIIKSLLVVTKFLLLRLKVLKNSRDTWADYLASLSVIIYRVSDYYPRIWLWILFWENPFIKLSLTMWHKPDTMTIIFFISWFTLPVHLLDLFDLTLSENRIIEINCEFYIYFWNIFDYSLVQKGILKKRF